MTVDLSLLKSYISERLVTNAGTPNSAIIRRSTFINSDECESIKYYTRWLDKLNADAKMSLRIMVLHHDITDFSKCELCGNPVRFKTYNKFPRFCSKRCSCRSSQELRRTNELNNYAELKKSETVHSLEDTKQYIKSKWLKSGIYEKEAVYADFYNSIMHYSPEDVEYSSFSERMYFILNDMKSEKDKPVCKHCSGSVKFITSFYREFCSNSCQSKHNVDKRQSTYENRTGYSHPHHNPEVKERMKQHCLETLGVEHQWNNPEPTQRTKIERYDDPYYNNPEQISKTWNEKFSDPEQKDKIIKQREEGMLKNHGVKNTMSSPEIRQKIEETMIERYGAKNYSQSIHGVNGYQWKDYELPSGEIIRIQGYENFLLDELLEKYDESEIKTSRSDMPEFWYELDGKQHRYFPDVYVPSTNTIYEVKSEYTMKCNETMNERKFQCVKDSGYNFVLKIY